MDKIREDLRQQHREQLHRWRNVRVGHLLSDEDEDDDRVKEEALQRQRQGANGGPWEEPEVKHYQHRGLPAPGIAQVHVLLRSGP